MTSFNSFSCKDNLNRVLTPNMTKNKGRSCVLKHLYKCADICIYELYTCSCLVRKAKSPKDADSDSVCIFVFLNSLLIEYDLSFCSKIPSVKLASHQDFVDNETS